MLRNVEPMDKISGLPAHPLLVHVPIVLLPLAAIGAILMMVKPQWYERFRWPVLILGAIGTLGAILGASSGEELEDMIRAREGAEGVAGIESHAEAGEFARNIAILFLVLLAAYVVIPWVRSRRAGARSTHAPNDGPSWLRPLLMALVAICAVVVVIAVIRAGHSGADQVWSELTSGS